MDSASVASGFILAYSIAQKASFPFGCPPRFLRDKWHPDKRYRVIEL
jgi:hypothetical protein